MGPAMGHLDWLWEIGLPKNLQNFASELEPKSGIMRGLQKGITLGGRTPGSAQKVFGRWWWEVGF